MFVESFRNIFTDRTISFPDMDSLLLEPLSEIKNSEILGPFGVGHYSTINRCRISGFSNLGVSSYIADTKVGRYCSIGSRVSIGGFEHPTNFLASGAWQWGQGLLEWGLESQEIEGYSSDYKPVNPSTQIGSDCWIGNNAVVLSGVTISDGVIIGAGSVVTRDVPPYAIVIGNPGKILRFRFNDSTISKLLSNPWFNLSPAELAGVNFLDVDIAITQISDLLR